LRAWLISCGGSEIPAAFAFLFSGTGLLAMRQQLLIVDAFKEKNGVITPIAKN
jgi:hypothetical protein